MLTIERTQDILRAFEGLTRREAETVIAKIMEEFDAAGQAIVFSRELSEKTAAAVANWQGWEVPGRTRSAQQTRINM